MSNVRQALTGILAALISAVIIFGSIILALSETGHKIARLPESNPLLSTSMPPVATSKPGEPTYTAAPTRLPETPAVEPTSRCAQHPGWQTIEVLPGDTLETLAQDYETSPKILIEGNCLESEDLMIGTSINVPILTSTPGITPADTTTVTATATSTSQAQPTRAKSAQNKPKATPCGAPSYWVRYRIKSGDTLSDIGRLTGATVMQLRNANCLPSTLIRTGRWLWVPHAPPTATRRPTKAPTMTRTSPPPTIVPPDTPVPSDTPRPTEPPPPPSDTPLPTDTAVPPYP